ncbi:MAG: hypothetical protein JRN26_05270 [Nitrososphaerota archaeon]|nr:hypothetical protein [Nitrososphaerota archaeon]MDG6931902.1 hypothetical protein [Nitrososphaerota archaeon]MDG6936275.1 hypothetical protein [Nitrososphaerota archaeon]MDG6944618.1 hypothetical protein [Nitrososphaerota archaeon]
MDNNTVVNIDIADLVNTASAAGLDALKKEIESYQKLLVKDKLDEGYRKAGSYWKMIVTTLGSLKIRVVRLGKLDGGTYSPLLDKLHIRNQKYTRDVRMLCVDLASRLSYGDASEEVKKTNEHTKEDNTLLCSGNWSKAEEG